MRCPHQLGSHPFCIWNPIFPRFALTNSDHRVLFCRFIRLQNMCVFVCVFCNYANHNCSMRTSLSRALPFEPKRHHAPSFVSPTICILVTIAMITHLSMLPFQHPFVIPNQTTIFLIACLCRSHCSNHYCLPCTITVAPRASVKSHLDTMHREELPPLSTTLRSNSDSLPRGADLSPQ
jgi:hypothetical protein